VASNRSFFLFLELLAMLALQHEQFCVGRQYFTDRILKLPPFLDPAPHLFDPLLGDVLNTFFPPHHKGQRPDEMAAVIGTVTGGLTAPQMRKREGTREGIRGDREAAQQLELTLAQSGSKWSFTSMNHLSESIAKEDKERSDDARPGYPMSIFGNGWQFGDGPVPGLNAIRQT